MKIMAGHNKPNICNEGKNLPNDRAKSIERKLNFKVLKVLSIKMSKPTNKYNNFSNRADLGTFDDVSGNRKSVLNYLLRVHNNLTYIKFGAPQKNT